MTFIETNFMLIIQNITCVSILWLFIDFSVIFLHLNVSVVIGIIHVKKRAHGPDF